ncbi:DODA-type extradiol aromatic ring-opening family dioxygenase [Ideonella livida]|uniref:Dioxygenase n=1 Tax=Ideonella livida TaxID=2707176 RepID=A0A7C9PFC5_9BURK|nr:class III extradiol ring-cleavage dioxygenase [Ideonella livida]NDY90211.1 dioxygenase [Ideonella livida]
MNTVAPLPLPSLYISHGSPMTALEPGEAGAAWQALGPALDRLHGRPRAIVVASAHSLTREPVVLGAARQETVHDFYGFPDALYQLRYDTAGSPAVAARVAALIRAAGLPVHELDEGGMDHGVWTPLRSMYPEADIPVVPLAWPPNWTPAQLLALGQALAPLRHEGVLVIGSGAITHNLRLWAGGRGDPDQAEWPQCAEFRGWIEERSRTHDWDALLDYRRQAPHAVMMHPTDEHFVPFYIAAGAAGSTQAPAARVHASVTWGHLGMDIYAFGEGAQALQSALETGAAAVV